MSRRSRPALPRLSPAQRWREIIEIIATGLARMPLAATGLARVAAGGRSLRFESAFLGSESNH